MKSIWTRECTDVYYHTPTLDHLPTYSKKKVNIKEKISQRPFRSQDRFDRSQVEMALFYLQRQLNVEESKPTLAPLRKRLSRKDQVNKKRRLIQKCIENRSTKNITEIAKASNADRGTVKSVMRDLELYGEVREYEYNNLKKVEDLASLMHTIEEEKEGFITVSQLKRNHPMFSRKMILKTLHGRNFSYRLMPKERKDPIVRIVDSTNVCRVISHLAQAMADPNTTLLYCDEMKFPLYQTAEKRWVKKDADPKEMMVYNRRPALDYNLNAIAMCSLEKFEAIQVFQREVNGADFLYFMNEAISQMPAGKHYTVLVDNAGWHHANVVSKTEVSKFLYFNEPYLFQLNIIENAFSFIRDGFRNRPIVETLEEETKLIVEIFFDGANLERFNGLVKNHLKVLLEFLNKHKQEESK